MTLMTIAAGVGILLLAASALAGTDERGALMGQPTTPRTAARLTAPHDRTALDALDNVARPDDRPRSKRVLINACGGTTTPGYWIEQLKDRDPDTRVRAAQALGEMRDRTAVAALARALKDGDQNVRLAAVRALGRIGPRANAAAPALRHVLTENDAHLREEAGWALEKIGAASQK